MTPETAGDQQPAEYPCCHQLEGRPHTDYCQAYRRAVAGLHPNQTEDQNQ